MGFVIFPTAYCGLVNRLADLPAAQCPDNSVAAIEFQTAFVPIQLRMGNELTSVDLRLVDQILVLDGQNVYRQHFVPMVIELVLQSVIMPQCLQVSAIAVKLVERAGKTGDASVDRVAAGVNEDRLRKQQ